MKPRLILKALRAFRAGRVGDAAAYKAAAGSAPAYPEVGARLAQLTDPFPRIDVGALRALPADTFGHAYARFMDENGLSPLLVSPAVAEELARINLLAVRYTILHDAFHVLLGYDASLAGELGVWTFVARQHYCVTHRRAALAARLLYPLWAPTRHAALRAARLRAEALAPVVPSLIAEPIETWWALSLAKLRERLRISPAVA